MIPFLLQRLAWMAATLLGLAIAVFLLLDAAPGARRGVDPAGLPQAEVVRSAQAVAALEAHYGLRDPATGELRPVWERFGRWLGRLASGRLAGPGETEAAFRRRIAAALPVTLMVGGGGLLMALAVALTLGPWLGLRAGGASDRRVSTVLFALDAMPPLVLATLLAVLFAAGGLIGGFPAGGLPEDGQDAPGLLLLLHHLALPVLAVAVAPAVVLTRLVRTGVAEADQRLPADALRGWGAPPRRLRRHVLRAGLGPFVTALGTTLPMAVTGSLVVEQVFGLYGIGRLATQAVLRHEPAMVMALTLMVAVATLTALLLSDLLQRWRDPRTELR